MKYIVNIFLNGVHWDNSYANNNSEAIDYKNYIENNNFSIWDKINGDALEDFIKVLYEEADSQTQKQELMQVLQKSMM